MMMNRFLMGILLLVLAGCQSIPDEIHLEGENLPQTQRSETPHVTDTLIPNPSTPTPSPIPPEPSPTPTPILPCSPEQCSYLGHFWMQRPIAPKDNDQVDPSYRYGSTQEGARPTHHGVEFVNEEGTAVLAAAEGLVIVAGNDSQEAYADFPFYYGNLVIIEHHFNDMEEPVYTLYGHLSSVQTQVGAYVQAGDQIGAVGYTGVAEWSHLHFEVRFGENKYRDTRNPELWLQPHLNEDDLLNGALAGRIIDEYGSPIYIPNVVIERLGTDGSIQETLYVETYADFTVNGDLEYGENFAISDIHPGSYRVSFVARGLQVWEVELLPGQLTLIIFDAREQ